MDKFDEMVEALEDNEDLVECQECFDLFPKADCIKQEHGYLCPTCGRPTLDQERKIDFTDLTTGLFDQDFPDVSEYAPGTVKDWEAEPTVMDALDALIADEIEAIDGYEEAEEIIEDSDYEDKDELLKTIEHIKEEEEEHIEELKDDCPECEVPTEAEVEEDSKEELPETSPKDKVRDSDQKTESVHSAGNTWSCIFKGKEIGTVEATSEEEALEKMQQEYPEYPYGECDGCFEVSLVEADCTKHKAITHSEEEKTELKETYEKLFEQKLDEEALNEIWPFDGKKKARNEVDSVFGNGYMIYALPSKTKYEAETIEKAVEACKALSKKAPKEKVFILPKAIPDAQLKGYDPELQKLIDQKNGFAAAIVIMQNGKSLEDNIKSFAKFKQNIDKQNEIISNTTRNERSGTDVRADLAAEEPASEEAPETPVEEPASVEETPAAEEPAVETESPSAPAEEVPAEETPAAPAAEEETPAPAADTNAESRTRNSTYNGHALSDKAIGNFKKLMYLTGLKVYDAMGELVPTDKKGIVRIKPDTLLDFEIEVNGERKPLKTWLETMVKNKIIAESFVRELYAEVLKD